MHARPTTPPGSACLRIGLLLCGLTFALLWGSGTPAHGQIPNTATARVDSAKLAFDQVEAGLARSDQNDKNLQELRAELDPIAAQLATAIADLTPRIEAAKARLAQLGAAPKPGDPPEPAEVSDERSAQEKLFGDLDATAKRAKVLAIQVAQTSDAIVARRRAIFTHALFARSTSIFSPKLWLPVLTNSPADIKAVETLGEDWVTASLNRLSLGQKAGFLVLLALVLSIAVPAWRVARRLQFRDPEANPSRLHEALAALRVAAAAALVPSVTVLLLGAIFEGFGLPGQFSPIGRAIQIGVIVVALASGVARGFLAPKSPNWRLPPITDEAAKRLHRIVVGVTTLIAVSRLADALNEVIGAALANSVVTRDLVALAVAMILFRALRQGLPHDSTIARSAQVEHWRVMLRLLGWALVALILVAIFVGYVAFASFVIEQTVTIAGTFALLYVLMVVAEEGTAAAFAPDAPIGRTLVVGAGLSAEALDQLAILLGGFLRVVLCVGSVLLVMAPFRIESGDMLATVKAAIFGFTIGDFTISLSSIVVAIMLFGLAMLLTRVTRRWLEVKYLPHTRLDTGLQNSIKTSLGYLGVAIGSAMALAHLGLSFDRLAIVAGALSVGIGFGLQSIVNNFVSGLILLWERAIRVGDWITVGDEQGYVRRINVRTTEIETFDRALVIMPNGSLVSGIVKNWVRNDRVGRIKLPFTLPVTADPEQIRKILVGVAKTHNLVLSIPTPQVYFTGMTDVALRFDLVCFIEDIESSIRVTSDLLFEIHAKFKEAGLVVAAAPPVVTSPALDKLDAWLNAKVTETPPRSATGT